MLLHNVATLWIGIVAIALHRENHMSDEDMLALDEVLQGVVELAENVPFLILNMDGSIRHASKGALSLHGGRLEVDMISLELGDEHGLNVKGIGPFLQHCQSGELAFFHRADGKQDAFRVFVRPTPVRFPKLVLLRLEPVELPVSAEQGVEILSPSQYPNRTEFHGMWTRAQKMVDLFQIVERVAENDVTVLVRGESGTGKEKVARAIHAMSRRSNRPFVAVNCAALTPTLLESEMFGHVKGAFTGAVRDRAGLFEQANGGTILLDEVAELSLELQAKLLRVLQERSFLPVGGNVPKSVDVRIISATHQSLRQAVAEGRFREDLMFRLRVVPLWIPPLRERREDLELLTSLFLEQLGEMGRHCFSRIHPSAMQALLDHTWPGNVRELQNVLEYASAVGTGDLLLVSFLPPEFREPVMRRIDPELPPVTTQLQMSRNSSPVSSEKERILQALAETNYKKGDAAKLLGMHRTSLWRKMKAYGLAER